VGPSRHRAKTLLSKRCREGEFLRFIISGLRIRRNSLSAPAPLVVRDLFEASQKKGRPASSFIDELDAIANPVRLDGRGRRNDEARAGRLNQLLTEMDGFASTDKTEVIVLAATNQPETRMLRLLRPGAASTAGAGRSADLSGRKMILDIYAKKVESLAEAVDLDRIAQATSGFCGRPIWPTWLTEAACSRHAACAWRLEQKDLNERSSGWWRFRRSAAGCSKTMRSAWLAFPPKWVTGHRWHLIARWQARVAQIRRAPGHERPRLHAAVAPGKNVPSTSKEDLEGSDRTPCWRAARLRKIVVW